MPVDCEDNNGCSTDTCDAATGCASVDNDATCDDSDVCTEGDVCNAGKCTAGKAKACGDDNVCTDDACDPTKGGTNTPTIDASAATGDARLKFSTWYDLEGGTNTDVPRV